jgi:two-component system nitrate/nitrite response regulator NarL
MATAVAIDVFIVAGVRLYREGLVHALGGDARFRVAGAAAGHAEALDRIARLRPRPRVALLDIGAGAGLVGTRRLRAALPDVPVVALVIEDTDESVVAWAEAGVAGFVTRDTSLEDLMSTVECVAQGGARCSARATAALLRRLAALADRRRPETRRGALTPREREIVALIDQGLSNKQIARELHIELATVKNHVHSVLEKLHVERRGAAAAVMRGHD